jgi:hypothetical protein
MFNSSLVVVRLPALNTIDSHLTIGLSDSLSSLDLSNLHTVGGNIDFSTSGALTNLEGLSNLTSVGNRLLIQNLYTLLTLGGLESVEAVGGDLDLSNNAALNSLDGFSGLQTVGARLTISTNPCLSQAEAEEFATTIAVSGDTSVENNGAWYPCD